jgi:hypothetical protein
MKQKRYGIAIVVLALAALVLLTGCDWVVEVYPSYTINGEVINAVVDAEATGSKVSQPLVILENSEGTEVARTTASTTGRFQFANVTPGVYTVTAELSGYAFVDRTVELTGAAVEDVVLIGFESPEDTTISIFVIWGDNTDIDAYLSFPATYLGGTNPPIFTEPYQLTTVDGYASTYVSGSNQLASSGRFTVGWSGDDGLADAEKTTTSLIDVYGAEEDDIPVAARLREVESAPGPETIQLRGLPFPYTPVTPNSTVSDSDVAKAGLAAGTYAWLGTAVYYLDAFGTSATIADEGDPGTATPIVILAQGSEVKGRYYIPDFTTVETTSVLRINMFLDSQGEVYQFVPDGRVVTPGLGVNSASDDGILVLRGRPRQ